MMKMPKSVKIGAHNFDIIFPYVFEDVTGTLGMCCLSSNKIKITDQYEGEKRPSDRINKTLLHEILHAIDDLSGHHVFQTNEGWDEAALDAWAEWLVMLLYDNPEMVGLFTTKVKP